MVFLSLSDSPEMAGLEPAPQEVACMTNGENRRRWLDDTTDKMTGEGGLTPPPTGRETGAG